MNYYTKTHTINIWVKTIQDKFNDIGFNEREKNIAKILGITSPSEIAKIKKASLIVFGKTLGVETFEDACKKIGQSTVLPTFNNLDDSLAKKFTAEYKIITIIKALNEGWYPNWNNSNESKYWPYFNMNKNGGFSYWDTTYLRTYTDVPSALLLKSSELAEYCGLMFIDLYKYLYE